LYNTLYRFIEQKTGALNGAWDVRNDSGQVIHQAIMRNKAREKIASLCADVQKLLRGEHATNLHPATRQRLKEFEDFTANRLSDALATQLKDINNAPISRERGRRVLPLKTERHAENALMFFAGNNPRIAGADLSLTPLRGLAEGESQELMGPFSRLTLVRKIHSIEMTEERPPGLEKAIVRELENLAMREIVLQALQCNNQRLKLYGNPELCAVGAAFAIALGYRGPISIRQNQQWQPYDERSNESQVMVRDEETFIINFHAYVVDPRTPLTPEQREWAEIAFKDIQNVDVLNTFHRQAVSYTEEELADRAMGVGGP